MSISQKKARKRRPREPESTVGIIDGALKSLIPITEKGVARKITIVEAIVIQLLRAETAGNRKAAAVRLRYQRLGRNYKRDPKIIVIHERGEMLPEPIQKKREKDGQHE
jgi:hypothetical protein